MEIQTRRVLKLIKIMRDQGHGDCVGLGKLRSYVQKYAGSNYKTWNSYKEIMTSFQLVNNTADGVCFNWPNILKFDADIAAITRQERVFLEGVKNDLDNSS